MEQFNPYSIQLLTLILQTTKNSTFTNITLDWHQYL